MNSPLMVRSGTLALKLDNNVPGTPSHTPPHTPPPTLSCTHARSQSDTPSVINELINYH